MAQLFELLIVNSRNDFILGLIVIGTILDILGLNRFGAVSAAGMVVFICKKRDKLEARKCM